MNEPASSNLVRLTGLWKNESKAGSTYLTGSISASSRLLILPNERKEKDTDPDFIAFMAPQEKREPKPREEPPTSHRSFDF